MFAGLAYSASLSNVIVKEINSRLYNVSWQASDNLVFSVFLKGENESIIGDYVQKKNFIADLRFARTGSYKIIVRARDGMNNLEAKSNYFIIEDRKPFARISIVNGSVFAAGNEIYAEGFAYDSDDGYLDDFAWKLNGEEAGNEPSIILQNLEAGNYFLELETRDTGGNLARDSVRFSIEDNYEPDVSIKNIEIIGSGMINGTHIARVKLFNIRQDTWCNLSLRVNSDLIETREVYVPANQFSDFEFDFFPETAGNHEIKAGAECDYDKLVGNNLFSLNYYINKLPVILSRCSELNQAGTYILNSDLYNSNSTSCIVISAENVTLDCQSHAISSMNGIYSNKKYTTIKNCRINYAASVYGSGYGYGASADSGLYIKNANNARIENNTINGNFIYGILLENSSFNFLKDNKASNSGNSGIYISGNNNRLEKNAADNNNFNGILIVGNNNMLGENRACDNTKTNSKFKDLRCSGINNSGSGNVFDKVDCNSVNYNSCRGSISGYVVYSGSGYGTSGYGYGYGNVSYGYGYGGYGYNSSNYSWYYYLYPWNWFR